MKRLKNVFAVLICVFLLSISATVLAENVNSSTASGSTLTVTGNNVSLRDQNDSTVVLGFLNAGDTVTLVEYRDTFSLVDTGLGRGLCSNDFLSVGAFTPSPTASPTHTPTPSPTPTVSPSSSPTRSPSPTASHTSSPSPSSSASASLAPTSSKATASTGEFSTDPALSLSPSTTLESLEPFVPIVASGDEHFTRPSIPVWVYLEIVLAAGALLFMYFFRAKE